MDERKSARAESLVELIELVLQETASDDQKRELQARLLASSEDRRLYLHRLNLHSALRRQFMFDVEEETATLHGLASGEQDSDDKTGSPLTGLAKLPWAITAVSVIALIAAVYLLRPNAESEIATITELDGALRWTGDGGRVVSDLEAGSSLAGGTLESLSADSWALLEFRDGSTVTISGHSALTISEREQKQLYLREGSLSASVTPQPGGKPMLIYTPTAKLEVRGTRLNVDAEPSSTLLRVNEGRVRVTRLADGSVTEVPAEHQVVASANRLDDFDAKRRPTATSWWQSYLPIDAKRGIWLQEPGETVGSLRAKPILVKNVAEELNTLYIAVLGTDSEPRPVALTSGAKFRVRGRIESAADVTFTFGTRYRKGGFAGRYTAKRTAETFRETGELFDIELPLSGFQARRDKSPDSPVGLELNRWWCFTRNEDVGLAITRVELLPPTALP